MLDSTGERVVAYAEDGHADHVETRLLPLVNDFSGQLETIEQEPVAPTDGRKTQLGTLYDQVLPDDLARLLQSRRGYDALGQIPLQ
ncbi:hypothetical protein MB02_11310 [Croceicoccus estronivorus]|nr:hypothetical protein MB02_11310 [Croceicoccus estronivorus]